MLFAGRWEKADQTFPIYTHRCVCVHLYRFLNKLAEPDFYILFCRNSASCRETLASLKCLSFSPLLSALAFPLPSCPSRDCREEPEAAMRWSGSTAPLASASPSLSVQAPSPWKPQAARQAVLSVRGGWSWPRPSKSEGGGLEEPWKKLPV